MEELLEQIYDHKDKFNDDPLNSFDYWKVGLAYNEDDHKDLVKELNKTEIKTLKSHYDYHVGFMKKVYEEILECGCKKHSIGDRIYDKGKILFFFRIV